MGTQEPDSGERVAVGQSLGQEVLRVKTESGERSIFQSWVGSKKWIPVKGLQDSDSQVGQGRFGNIS